VTAIYNYTKYSVTIRIEKRKSKLRAQNMHETDRNQLVISAEGGKVSRGLKVYCDFRKKMSVDQGRAYTAADIISFKKMSGHAFRDFGMSKHSNEESF